MTAVRLVIAIVAVLGVATVHAQTVIELPKTATRLELPDGWQPRQAPGVLVAYADADGALLAVSRADVPNPDAWRSSTKQAYAGLVERGIRSGIPGAKRVRRKLTSASGIPALDIEARRADGATVIVRVLLFRTYALSLAIEVPERGDPRAARAIAAGFAPPAPQVSD